MDRFAYEPQADLAPLVQEVAPRLRRGEVGILPTETVYGLMCLAAAADARERIFRIKGRGSEQPLQVLVTAPLAFAAHGVTPTPLLEALAQAFCPGPLTLVVPTHSGYTVGLRAPDHPLLQALIAEVGPLAATSANASGEDPEVCLAGDFASLREAPDFAVLGGPRQGVASTVLAVRGERWEVRREGGITAAAIAELADRVAVGREGAS